MALAGQLPQIWADPKTSDAHRKALLRCLVDKVVLGRGEHGTAMVRIVWRGGEISELAVKRPVAKLATLERGDETRRRVIELATTGMPDGEIARHLTEDGHRSAKCPDRVLPITVQRIRHLEGIPAANSGSRWQHASGTIGIQDLGRRLGIPTKWLYVQLRGGRIQIDRPANGAYRFQDCETVMHAVRSLRDRQADSIDLRARQSDYMGHPHG